MKSPQTDGTILNEQNLGNGPHTREDARAGSLFNEIVSNQSAAAQIPGTSTKSSILPTTIVHPLASSIKSSTQKRPFISRGRPIYTTRSKHISTSPFACAPIRFLVAFRMNESIPSSNSSTFRMNLNMKVKISVHISNNKYPFNNNSNIVILSNSPPRNLRNLT
jgi:hypothetical protein